VAGIGRERFHVTALALGVDGVEGERGFARAREPGEHHQPVARDFEIDVLEIVLARAADRDYARAISRCLAARAALVEEVVHTVRRAINIGKAKAVIPTRPKPKKRPGAALRAEPLKERSKNGGVSLVRRAAPALPSLSCGQRPRHWPQCDVDTPERDGRRRCRGELQWKSFDERR